MSACARCGCDVPPMQGATVNGVRTHLFVTTCIAAARDAGYQAGLEAVAKSTRPSDSGQQTCKCCGRPDKFNFDVPDETWSAVVPKALQNRVVCLSCFDDFARERGIDYGPSLSVLHFAGNQAAFEFNVAWAVPVEHTEATR